MPSIDFLLAIHNHQPVGNFDDVIEDAYQRAYRPFLEVLERFPGMRVALHNSGCLLDWLSLHRPEYLDHLGRLVEAGQVELMTGGYYEPILPSIPEGDREGQIRKLSQWLTDRFGRRPQGLWLTERVWEPGLVSSLARAGVTYTMVDDSHFLAAGTEPGDLWGHYLTEDQGVPLAVFPISKELRYAIPFRPPEETIALLRRLAEESPGRVAVLGDDGEKFGVWPNTHALVYEEGWLERFFTLLQENADWLHVRVPGDVLNDRRPVGKVYLPTASYEEMMEWALPPDAQQRLHVFREQLEGDRSAQFVRGGFWRNFFARYPESDHLNKRMLLVRRDAERMAIRDPKRSARAMDHVWAAQCNCAYWHGVFGGLYLPHLRDALYTELLTAESILDGAREEAVWTASETLDFDCDGRDEIVLRNATLTLVLAPDEGGTLHEISAKPFRAALGNGLTRRPEAYHAKVRGAVAPGAPQEGSKSIHDLVLAKEEGLERFLHYDRYRRVSLVDRFLREDADPEQHRRGTIHELGDFVDGEYVVNESVVGGERAVTLTRTGSVWRGGDPVAVVVTKTLGLSGAQDGFSVAYRVEPTEAPLSVRFGVDWVFAMLAGDSPDHVYRIQGVDPDASRFGSLGETGSCGSVELLDRHRGFAVRLAWDIPATLWRAPIETVSLSEGGFERIYQASALLPWWQIEAAPGEPFQVTFRCEVSAL